MTTSYHKALWGGGDVPISELLGKTLASVRGGVDIRWYGESNGHYSESVDLTRVAGPSENT